MKKLNLKYLLFYALLVFFTIAVFLFLTFPKFLFLDKKLSEKGLYLTADSVKESFTSLTLKGVSLYDQTSKLARFDVLSLSVDLFGLEMSGFCEGKTLKLRWSSRTVKLTAKDFACFSWAENITLDITIKNGIHGSLLLKGLKLQDTKLDQLSLDMRGKIFTARAKFMGFELVGDGQIVFNPSDLLKSKLNGQVSGGGIRLILSGTLEKPQVLK